MLFSIIKCFSYLTSQVDEGYLNFWINDKYIIPLQVKNKSSEFAKVRLELRAIKVGRAIVIDLCTKLNMSLLFSFSTIALTSLKLIYISKHMVVVSSFG